MAKNKGGRPTVMTPDVLAKLEEAFKMDCTDEEACLHADIAMSTLYHHQNKDPKFLEKKNIWKSNPFLVARRTIMKGMETDHNHALRYMERKRKDEFSLKTEHEVKGVSLQEVFSGLGADVSEALKEVLKSKLSGK